MNKADRYIALLLAAIFLYGLVETATYPWQVAVLPALTCAAGILCCLFVFVRSLVGKEEQQLSELYTRDDVLAVLGLLAGIIAIVLCGFFWGGIIVVCTYTFIMAGRRVLPSIGAALPIAVLPFVERVMQFHLFRGLIELPYPW